MAELKNIRIAVSGLYDYAYDELPTLRVAMPGNGAPDWVEKKDIYKVYRPAPVLAAACDKFKMLPLTHHHPRVPVDGQNFRDLAVGYTGENPEVDYLSDKNEVGIKSTVMMYDDEALKAYDNGEIQLSPGYIAVFEWKKGTAPNGEPYDIIMKEITEVNHLALLPNGRGGEDAVVLDNAPETKDQSIFSLIKGKCTKDKKYQMNEISPNTGLQKTPEGWKPPKGDHEISKEENEAAKKRVFGKEFTGVKGTDAIEKIIQEKEGFVQNAFTRKDIGGIDVVYGEITNPKTLKGYGIKKILAKHPDITPEIITEVIEKGNKEDTYNGCNIVYKDWIVGLNKGYRENGKYVTTDNWIVTSFKNEKEKGNDTIASAATFTPDTSRPGNLLTDEIIIHSAPKVKSIFEIVKGSVFDRVRK